MGNIQNAKEVSKGTQITIDEQYRRISKTKSLKKALTLSEILEVKTPENYPFTFNHVAILYVCDKDLDCTFSRDDLINFVIWMQEKLYGVRSYQFKAELQTEALDTLIHSVMIPENQKKIIDWVIGMLIKDNPSPHKQGYLKIQQLKLIYDIFNIRTLNNIDYQYFINLVRRSSVEMGHQIIDSDQNDEMEQYVSVKVCQYFVKCFLKGMKKIVKEIGFDKPIL